jgi:hypothetical protein
MCHLNIAVDQSIHTVGPVFDAIERSPFYLRSIYVVPVGWSRKADLHLSLGGGSKRDLNHLLGELAKLPAVLSTHHTMPPI